MRTRDCAIDIAMGLPVRHHDSSTSAFVAPTAAAAAVPSCNGIIPTMENSSSPQHIFVYGNSRPDMPRSEPLDGVQSKRAWLLGSRLYSYNRDGVHRAAVRLEEPGHAVVGYAMSVNSPNGIGRLLETFQRREFSQELYERDSVEVITEAGERVRSYVYHRPEVDQSNPVPSGDWLQHLEQ